MSDLLRKIAEQAAVVRKLQVKYFKTRSKEDLISSKQEEKMLDEMLKQYKGCNREN